MTLKTATVTPLAGPGEGQLPGVDRGGTACVARDDRRLPARLPRRRRRVVRADSADVSTQAKTIAADLARRIRAVAAGTIAETLVPLPATGGTTTAPGRRPRGSRCSPTRRRATVEREGYGEPDADVLARFSREFDLDDLLAAAASAFEAEVELYEQESDATMTCSAPKPCSGRRGERAVRERLTGEAGRPRTSS